MKYKPSLRMLGRLFIIFSIIGILFSIAGIGLIWYLRPKVKNTLSGVLVTLNETMVNTDASLLIMSNVIEITKTNVVTLEATIGDLDSTLASISDSLDTTATLIGDDVRLTIITTQTALSSAAESSKLIDNFLLILASIPFIGADYQPDVPLHISLEQVSSNLDDIPQSLEAMEQTLSDAASGLDILNENMTRVSEDIRALETDLTDANKSIKEYRQIIKQVKEKTISLQENLGRYLIIMSVIFSLLLLFLGIAQISLFLEGWRYTHDEIKVVNLADIQREKQEDTP
jgi:methyl-accepting chemotaxis protein